MKIASSILGSLLAAASCLAHAQYLLIAPENPPFVMFNDSKPSGIAVDIVREMFERAKVDYKIVNMPLARGMEKARRESSTCVFPVQRAQDVEAEYRWVSPILITRSGLFVRPDSTLQVRTLSDAKRFRIGVLRASGDAKYLMWFGFNVEEAITEDQNLRKLMIKRFDLWATDVQSVKYFNQRAVDQSQQPREVLVFRTSLGSLACSTQLPKADLLELQDTLDAMIRDGTVEKLMNLDR